MILTSSGHDTPETGLGAAPNHPGSAAASAMAIAGWMEQDEILRNLWLAGEAPAQIAEKLGRSVPAIMTRAARLALPRRFAPGRKPSGRRSFMPPPKPAVTRQTHPGPKTAPEATKGKILSERVCLMCLTKFPSEGVHNRICSSCKDSNAYQAGARLPDLDFPV